MMLELDLSLISIEDAIEKLKKASKSIREVIIRNGERYLISSEEEEGFAESIKFTPKSIEAGSFKCAPSAISLEADLIADGLISLDIAVYENTERQVERAGMRVYQNEENLPLAFGIIFEDKVFSNVKRVFDLFEILNLVLWKKRVSIAYF